MSVVRSNQYYIFMVEYVQERFGIVIMDLSVQDVLMNRFHMSKTNVCNLIGLVIKQHIYAERCKGTTSEVHAIKSILIRIESIERYIALKTVQLVSTIGSGIKMDN